MLRRLMVRLGVQEERAKTLTAVRRRRRSAPRSARAATAPSCCR